MNRRAFGLLALSAALPAAPRAGSAQEAAWPTRPVRIIVFALTGLLAGLAGLMQSARLEAADPNAGTGMELQVIAAVVIGGTSLMGGRGSVVTTAFGVLIIAVLEAGLAQVGASEPSKRIITGCVIVAAVIVDTLRQRRAAA